MRFIEYFLKNCIAHTLFMTWGQGQNFFDDKEPYDTVRVILWARNSVRGSKHVDAVIPALCELAGHILIKGNLVNSYKLFHALEINLRLSLVEDTYKNVNEEQIVSLLHEACHEQFIRVKNYVQSII